MLSHSDDTPRPVQEGGLWAVVVCARVDCGNFWPWVVGGAHPQANRWIHTRTCYSTKQRPNGAFANWLIWRLATKTTIAPQQTCEGDLHRRCIVRQIERPPPLPAQSLLRHEIAGKLSLPSTDFQKSGLFSPCSRPCVPIFTSASRETTLKPHWTGCQSSDRKPTRSPARSNCHSTSCRKCATSKHRCHPLRRPWRWQCRATPPNDASVLQQMANSLSRTLPAVTKAPACRVVIRTIVVTGKAKYTL